MKALTLTQPFATLIAIGAKRIETRNWSTDYRGPLAIHAAKGFPKWARSFSQTQICDASYPPMGEYPLGCVVATCRLVGVLPTDSHTEWRRLAVLAPLSTDQEFSLGDYSAGRFAWILEDVVQLPEPIPAKGRLGLWEWNQ